MGRFLLPGVLALLAFFIIAFIVFRHLPQAASIDLEALPAEQEAAMKAALLERRLKRRLLDIQHALRPYARGFFQAIGGFFSGLYHRVAQLEQRYRRHPQSMSAAEQEQVRQKIHTFLDEARAAQKDGRHADAESRFIEVLSWDPKNLPAYLGLATVYFEKKEFAQAKETFKFLFKLQEKQNEEGGSLFALALTDKERAEAYYDYAISLQSLGETAGAKTQAAQASSIDAKNPKFLDKLIELSILTKDRAAARQALDTLKSVNPDNQKLTSLEEQVRAILPL